MRNIEGGPNSVFETLSAEEFVAYLNRCGVIPKDYETKPLPREFPREMHENTDLVVGQQLGEPVTAK